MIFRLIFFFRLGLTPKCSVWCGKIGTTWARSWNRSREEKKMNKSWLRAIYKLNNFISELFALARISCYLNWSAITFADIKWVVNQRNKRLTRVFIMTSRKKRILLSENTSHTEWWHYHGTIQYKRFFSTPLLRANSLNWFFFLKFGDVHWISMKTAKQKLQCVYNRTITAARCSNSINKFF